MKKKTDYEWGRLAILKKAWEDGKKGIEQRGRKWHCQMHLFCAKDCGGKDGYSREGVS